MFWSLKQSLRDTIGSLSKTPSCLMHIVTFADNRLQERYTYYGLKSLKIYDQDEFVRKLNEEAADLLDGLNILFSKWGHNGDCENVKYYQNIHI